MQENDLSKQDLPVFNSSFVLQFFGNQKPHSNHFFIDVIKVFLVETEKKLPEVSICLRDGDKNKALAGLHYLKGSAGQVGAQKLAQIFQIAESTLYSKSLLPKEDWIEVLLLWETTKKEIEAWLSHIK